MPPSSPPDWLLVDPMLYLTPFLTLIKASDVSGPVTGAAAVALQRILGSELMCESTRHSGVLRHAAMGHVSGGIAGEGYPCWHPCSPNHEQRMCACVGEIARPILPHVEPQTGLLGIMPAPCTLHAHSNEGWVAYLVLCIPTPCTPHAQPRARSTRVAPSTRLWRMRRSASLRAPTTRRTRSCCSTLCRYGMGLGGRVWAQGCRRGHDEIVLLDIVQVQLPGGRGRIVWGDGQSCCLGAENCAAE